MLASRRSDRDVLVLMVVLINDTKGTLDDRKLKYFGNSKNLKSFSWGGGAETLLKMIVDFGL